MDLSEENFKAHQSKIEQDIINDIEASEYD